MEAAWNTPEHVDGVTIHLKLRQHLEEHTKKALHALNTCIAERRCHDEHTALLTNLSAPGDVAAFPTPQEPQPHAPTPATCEQDAQRPNVVPLAQLGGQTDPQQELVTLTAPHPAKSAAAGVRLGKQPRGVVRLPNPPEQTNTKRLRHTSPVRTHPTASAPPMAAHGPHQGIWRPAPVNPAPYQHIMHPQPMAAHIQQHQIHPMMPSSYAAQHPSLLVAPQSSHTGHYMAQQPPPIIVGGRRRRPKKQRNQSKDAQHEL